MRNVDRRSTLHLTRAVAWGLMVSTAACAAAVPRQTLGSESASPNSGGITSVTAGPDTSLFAAVVQSLVPVMHALTPPRERVLRVNPRPLKPDSPRAFLHDDDFADVEQAVVQKRSEALARLGIQQFTEYPPPALMCSSKRRHMSPVGVPAPPEAGPEPFCAILSVPRPGGVHSPPRQIDETQTAVGRGRWTTRVVIMYPGGYRVYDIVAEPVSQGAGWQIVEQRELFDMVS